MSHVHGGSLSARLLAALAASSRPLQTGELAAAAGTGAEASAREHTAALCAMARRGLIARQPAGGGNRRLWQATPEGRAALARQRKRGGAGTGAIFGRQPQALATAQKRARPEHDAWLAAQQGARSALPRERADDTHDLLRLWSARIDALVIEAAVASDGEQAVLLTRIAELERCEAELRHVIGRRVQSAADQYLPRTRGVRQATGRQEA